MPVNATNSYAVIYMLYTSSNGSALCTARESKQWLYIVASSVLKRACVIAKENDLQQCVGV